MFITELCLLIGLAFIWTIIFSVIVFVTGIFHVLGWILLLPLWLIFLIVALLFNITPLRQTFLSKRLWHFARRIIPPMSDTEREALEAGSLWWEAELFRGNPNWKMLHDLKLPSLSEEEQAFLDNQVTTLCDMLDDWKIMYERHDLSLEVWDYIRQQRFFAMAIPKKYGGLEFSAAMHSAAIAMISSRSISAAVNVMVPNSLGPAELLLRYGTEEQRQYYLPRLAAAEEIPCFGLTSSHVGSDAANMQDRGVVCYGDYQGKQVLGMRVTWRKRYITLAPVATLLGLAFKLYDPDHLLGEQESIGITVCLVPTNLPGVNIGRRHFPVFHAFLNGPTQGEDVFMPMDFIIGGQQNAGKGWRMLMECLSVGRAISLPSVSAAGAKLAYRMTGAYAKLREQFNLSIGKFEGVADKMGEIAGLSYMVNAMTLMTVGGVDLGEKPSLCSAISKYHATEMSRVIAQHSMDIHAGRAVQAGPRNYLLHSFMGVPMSITVEGANILTRSLIIFGQGAIRCHPYAYEELQVLYQSDQQQGLLKFDQLIARHFRYLVGNMARCFLHGVGLGKWLYRSPYGNKSDQGINDKLLNKYYVRLSRLSSALALSADVAMSLLGGELKRKESISARLGDVLSYLYIASACLKYYHDHQRPPLNVDNKTNNQYQYDNDSTIDRQHLLWTLQYCIYQSQEALVGVFSNYPRNSVGRALRFIIFPFGRRYRLPSDGDTQALAKIMMAPSAFRDRLTRYCYIGKVADDPTGRVEQAFQKMIIVEPLLKKLKQAIKAGQISRQWPIEKQIDTMQQLSLLNEQEAKQLKQFEHLRLDAIEVDDFDPQYFNRG